MEASPGQHGALHLALGFSLRLRSHLALPPALPLFRRSSGYNAAMAPSPVAALLAAYGSGETDPLAQARLALSRVNGNASHNSYISVDPDWTLAEARRQMDRAAAGESLPLYGVPVSLKDCFDLQGASTSVGSRFYAGHNGAASSDSWVAARLRRAGAVIVGKTHLHQLAYGITGENRDYGDCLQPADPALLTGGSSSGTAASLQEGSALAGIGTDTGGSVRAPAALCGIAGYRASLRVGDWSGGYHLAPSFDTLGWLFRDLRDAPLLANALFDLPPERPLTEPVRIGVLAGPLLDLCDSEILQALAFWQDQLSRLPGVAITLHSLEPDFWAGAWEIYAPIQASEASRLHHVSCYREFEPGIAARLDWGASIGDEELRRLREGHREFRRQQEHLFQSCDFVLAPTLPFRRLLAGGDHSDARPRFLRLTTPASLGGNPVVALPVPSGLQLIAAWNDDLRLLRLASLIGEQLVGEHSQETGATR
jgi:aspartyl-tRNA(Asn)/glutamyl-tRNA(Gln) amidotransferase subunit A